MKRLSIIIGVFLFCSQAKAQSWEIGAFGGGIGYLGDLNPKNLVKVSNPAFGVLVKRNLDPFWSIKLSVMHGEMEADDKKSDNLQHRERNLSFFTPLTEIGLQGEFNFFNYVSGLSKKRYTPYLFAGVALASYNPKTKVNGESVELNPFLTEGVEYKKSAIAVPYGLGLKYNVSGNWTIGAELGYRTTFTDYLDDVSGKYPDFPAMLNSSINLSDRSGEINNGVSSFSPGDQRGDSRPRDTYFFTGFTLTYSFLSCKCPSVF